MMNCSHTVQHSDLLGILRSRNWLLQSKFSVAAFVEYVESNKSKVLRITLSRFAIAFFLRSKCVLISWLQPPPAVIWEPKKRNSVTVSIVSPSICYEVMELDATILVFEC